MGESVLGVFFRFGILAASVANLRPLHKFLVYELVTYVSCLSSKSFVTR